MNTKLIYRKLSPFVVVGLFTLGGCATDSAKVPAEKISSAETAITMATQGNAGQFAPLALKIAQDHLQQAQDLLKQEKYREAERMADQAMADAQYAQAKAQSEAAKKAVEDVRESVATLKREISNSTNSGP